MFLKLRGNILYGKAIDKAEYEKAKKACALDKDIMQPLNGWFSE